MRPLGVHEPVVLPEMSLTERRSQYCRTSRHFSMQVRECVSSSLGSGHPARHLADPEAIEYFTGKITPQVNEKSPARAHQVAQTRALRFQNFDNHFSHVRGGNHRRFHFIVGELFQLLKPSAIRAVGGHRVARNMPISSDKLSADKPWFHQADLN